MLAFSASAFFGTFPSQRASFQSRALVVQGGVPRTALVVMASWSANGREVSFISERQSMTPMQAAQLTTLAMLHEKIWSPKQHITCFTGRMKLTLFDDSHHLTC